MSGSSPEVGGDEPDMVEDGGVFGEVHDEAVGDVQDPVAGEVHDELVDEVGGARPWWGRSAQEWWTLLRTWPGLLSIAIAVTIIGSWLPWSFDGPVRLRGLEG